MVRQRCGSAEPSKTRADHDNIASPPVAHTCLSRPPYPPRTPVIPTIVFSQTVPAITTRRHRGTLTTEEKTS